MADDGRCLEGFADTAECPHFGKIPPVPTQTAADAAPERAPSVPLPFATTLSVAEADQTLKSKECRVIAIAGPPDAGKTSLIAGLYDLFQLGQVRNIAFAQSFSLHAFEDVTHFSRAASRRGSPDTPRTSIGEVRFYHLDLVDTDSGAAPAVLLGDRAGEEYLGTRRNLDSAKSFPELARADVLTILVDGERLLDAGRRHNVRSEIRQTIHAFVEAEAIERSQRLAIVLTKVDMIRKSLEAGPRSVLDFEAIVASVRNTYGSKFATIEAFIVAAQPKTDGAKRGEGLDGLLAFWMSDPMRYQPTAVTVQVPPAERYFARMQKPHAGGNQ